MDKLINEQDLGVEGEINFSNEAVILNGITDNFATVHHEALLAQKLNSVIELVGGKITGDEALYI